MLPVRHGLQGDIVSSKRAMGLHIRAAKIRKIWGFKPSSLL